MGQWNVKSEQRNVIVGPWNVSRGLLNVIMGQCNMLMGPWNVNRGPEM